MAEQIRRTCVLLQEKWSSKGLDFQVEVADVVLDGSGAFLERAWMNLIDNACKFSPEGGRVAVTLEQRMPLAPARRGHRAALREQATHPIAVFCVENEGPALSSEALEHVFDRFYQADGSHATQGCGLGLPLVKKVIELHGGTISAQSTPSGHTSFTCELPIR